jgi:hypothetical protein
MRIGQSGPAVQHGHAAALQQPFVHAIEARDLGGAAAFERRPVQARRVDVPAIAACLVEPMRVVSRVVVEFLGDAPQRHAGAAEAFQAARFGQGDAGAALGGQARGAHAAAAATDDKEVEVETAHGGGMRGGGL